MNVSRNIQRLRKDKQLTQKQLAEILEVPQAQISRYESESYDGYTLATLRKLANALNVEVTELLK